MDVVDKMKNMKAIYKIMEKILLRTFSPYTMYCDVLGIDQYKHRVVRIC